MPQPDLRALAAECLPGKAEIELVRLGQGLFNDTYRARRGDRSFVLRVTREPAAQGRAAREFEASLVAVAAAARLAPLPVYHDAQRGVLALEWLPGRPWDAASICAPARIKQAAGLMRRVHELAVPRPVRACSPGGWVACYRDELARTERVADALDAQADRALEALAALPAEPPVVCHSDLHRLNVLEVAGGAPRSVLLDWEYAHQSEAGWDLAGWSANNDYTVQQSRTLLEAYRGCQPDRMQWQRFGLLRWLFDYVCVLWIRLYQRALPPGSADLAGRAVLLETRLDAAVCGKLADSDEPYFLEI